MKETFVLVTVMLLPLCGRAQESGSLEWSVRLDLKPMAPPASEPLRQLLATGGGSLTWTLRATSEPLRQLLATGELNSKPRLVGTLLEHFGPRHLEKPLASCGIMPAELLNVSAMRSYQRRVHEALRSLSPVMPPLYPLPFERLTAVVER